MREDQGLSAAERPSNPVRTDVRTPVPNEDADRNPRTPSPNALSFATEAKEPGTYHEGKGAARDAAARRAPGPRRNQKITTHGKRENHHGWW